jgi:hypothetical protein
VDMLLFVETLYEIAAAERRQVGERYATFGDLFTFSACRHFVQLP